MIRALTDEEKARRRLEMRRLAGLSPEERLADRRAKKARNKRDRQAKLTPEEHEQFLAKERAADRAKRDRNRMASMTPEERRTWERDRKRKRMEDWTPERRAKHNERQRAAYAKRAAKMSEEQKAERARRQRELQSNWTPEQWERYRKAEKVRDQRRAANRTDEQKAIRAQRERDRRKTLVKSDSPPLVPVIDTQPMTKEMRDALHRRAKRRALAESFRSSPTTTSAEQDRRNMEWAEREARRIAKEERQRQANRALAWEFNGAAARS